MHTFKYWLYFVQTLPYVGLITGGLKPDMAVFFQGTIPEHAQRYKYLKPEKRQVKIKIE